MVRVVVVHGIGQEFLGPESMARVVGPALRDGVRIAGGPRLTPEDVACAFYGNLFFKEGMRSVALPPWDESDVNEALEVELLEAWWEQAAQIDQGVVPPDAPGSRGLVSFSASRILLVERVRAALDALSGSRFFAKVSERLLIFALQQVRRYMSEPELKHQAQARIAEEITDETRVLVGHSLGSVIAYEALCGHPDWPVTDFVTLGSPLGMRSVIFDRLQPRPVEGIRASAWRCPSGGRTFPTAATSWPFPTTWPRDSVTGKK